MCSCSMEDGPSAFRQVIRKAKKDHRCCECRKTIPAGSKYEYMSGVWDGRGADFKTCLRCVTLREAHIEAEETLQAQSGPVLGCNPTIGGTLAAIRECVNDDGKPYIEAFRKARRGLLAQEAA